MATLSTTEIADLQEAMRRIQRVLDAVPSSAPAPAPTPAPPPAPPAAALSAADFGAKGDNATDNTAALQAAFAAGKAQKKLVFIPAGTYRHSGRITIDAVSVEGSGDGSRLIATTPANGAVRLVGDRASLAKVRLSSVATARLTNPDSAAVFIEGATNFTVASILVDSAGSAGIFMFGAHGGWAHHNRVTGTLADSIHVTYGTTDVVVEYNTVTNSGDDGIAVVSYGNEQICRNITVQFNTVENNKWGRNASVVGGDTIKILRNKLRGNLANLAAVYLGGETAFKSWGAKNVTVEGNEIDINGGAPSYHGAVMIFNDTANPSTGIVVRNNNITSRNSAAVQALGSSVDDVLVEGNNVGGKIAFGDGAALVQRGNITVPTNYVGPLPTP